MIRDVLSQAGGSVLARELMAGAARDIRKKQRIPTPGWRSCLEIC
ncbi:hypothetical protein [Methanothrix sp.]